MPTWPAKAVIVGREILICEKCLAELWPGSVMRLALETIHLTLSIQLCSASLKVPDKLLKF